MINGFYDINIEQKFVPYIGLGIGLANTSITFNPLDVDKLDDRNTGFAYQLMAGITWSLSEASEIFGGYRYRVTSDVEVDVSLLPAELEIENKSSSLYFGLRYHF
jgi:opacity protein-like surface antigen